MDEDQNNLEEVIKDARRKALEEAAQLCDEMYDQYGTRCMADDCASSIRTLIDNS